MFFLNLIGGFELTTATGEPVEIKSKKAKAILAYMAMENRKTMGRSHLAGVFWSESDEDLARSSLRQAVGFLKKPLNVSADVVSSGDRENISIDLSKFQMTHVQILAELSSPEGPDTIALGNLSIFELLNGFGDLDPAFEQWLTHAQRNWEEQVLEGLMSHLNSAQSSRTCKYWCAKQIADYDSSNEIAQRFIIAELARSGNINAALRRYKLLYEVLDEEHDTPPSEETQQLIARIKMGEFDRLDPPEPTADPKPRDPTPPAPDGDEMDSSTEGVPRLIVGNFTGRSDTENQNDIGWFRSELISALVRFREWVVFNYATGDASQFGDKFDDHAVYILEGSARRGNGGQVLALQLRNLGSGAFVWSDDFEISDDPQQDTSRDIIQKISAAMSIYISSHRVKLMTADTKIPKSAHDAWREGRVSFVDWTPEGEARIKEIFEKSIKKYPNFAPAYAGYVSHLNGVHLSCPGLYRTKERAQEALSYARRAVDLDPLDARNVIALAYCYAYLGRFEQARVNIRQAYKFNPNNPELLVPCAHGLSMLGDHSAAGEICDIAERINPVMPGWHWGYVCCVRFFMGEYDRSIAAAELALDSIPDIIGWRAAAQALAGDLAGARDSFKQFCATVSAIWKGDTEPSEENIIDWFLKAFPVAVSADHKRLSEGINLARLGAA